MKTKIVGWLYLIASTIFGVVSAFALYRSIQFWTSTSVMTASEESAESAMFYYGAVGLLLSIMGLFWASALRRQG